MRILTTLLITLFVSQSFAKTKIYWWHAMSGSLTEILNEMVANYNKSQDKYEVVAVHKGTYTETLNASIAAYRGKKQPHIVQVFEVGTMTMMRSGAVRSVEKIMKEAGHKVDWSNYLSPVLSYYRTSEGELLSMPFNSSTPVMYYNKELFKKAKIKNPPKTWEELHAATDKLVKSGAKCGFTSAWQSWVLVENFSAIHNVPLASKGNGFDGISKELKISNEMVANNIQKLQEGIKSGRFQYEGRRSAPAVNAFTAGKCAILMASTGSIAGVKASAKFKWHAAPLPYYKDYSPKNSIIGGASLWVFEGHKKEEYAGVADFFKFLASPKNQAWWHKETGYLPITKTAYQKLKKKGFYKKNSVQEVGILQMMRSEPGKYSRGVRLGNFTQVRDVINEQLEKIWAGKMPAAKGLKQAEQRSNRLLKQFARSDERRRKLRK